MTTAVIRNEQADNEQFCQHMELVMWIIRQHKMSADEVQNSLCWAWYIFTSSSQPGLTPRERCARAASIATRRRDDVFPGRNQRAVKRDAMTKRVEISHDDLSQVAEPCKVADVPGFKIEHIPIELQEVAEALSQGLTVREMHDLGIGRRMLARAKHGLEDWLVRRGWYVPRYALA